MADVPTTSLEVQGNILNMSGMNAEDLTSSKPQRPYCALLCSSGADVARDNPYQLQRNPVSQFKNILLQAHFEPRSISFSLLRGQRVR